MKSKGPRYSKCQTGSIIAANHVSYLDPITISSSSLDEVYFLARKSLFRNFFFGKFIGALHAIPIEPGKSNLKLFKTVVDLVKSNKKVILFIEGTRSKDGNLLPPQPGVGFIAKQAKAPIIPVYHHGAFEVWGRGKKLPKLFGNIQCVRGEPMPPELWEGKKPQEISDMVMEEIKKLKEKCLKEF